MELHGKDLLVILLIKLGVIASLASVIARFGQFRRLIFVEQRTPRQKLLFAVLLGVPFMLGVLTRLLAKYPGTDLSLEITVLAGLLGGGIAGLVVGMMVSLPAVLIPHEIMGTSNSHELLAAPLAVIYALVAGSARALCPDKEAIWKFSPFIDLSLYRSIRQRFKQPALDWQILFALMCALLEVMRLTVGRLWHQVFYLDSPTPWGKVLIVVDTMIGIGLPVRIWNSTRIERKLEEQQRMLLEARMNALVSQINPHFLFNTLNTVSSLIRFDPDKARTLLLKLSNILRRRLRSAGHFVPLKEELEFIDDYLDIEVARFGRDKLRIVKEIDEGTLEMFVPSMLLQPLVENSIRHGIGPRIEGGTITLRTWRQNGRLAVEVVDDGVGIPLSKQGEIYASGIGIHNVNERLKVLYGQEYRLKIESRPGLGTSIQFEIPALVPAEGTMQEPARASEVRASSERQGPWLGVEG
jgi:two-component system LytT family sensor kinase